MHVIREGVVTWVHPLQLVWHSIQVTPLPCLRCTMWCCTCYRPPAQPRWTIPRACLKKKNAKGYSVNIFNTLQKMCRNHWNQGVKMRAGVPKHGLIHVKVVAWKNRGGTGLVYFIILYCTHTACPVRKLYRCRAKLLPFSTRHLFIRLLPPYIVYGRNLYKLFWFQW